MFAYKWQIYREKKYLLLFIIFRNEEPCPGLSDA